MTESSKITITFNNKDYEIENKTEEQKVRPKGWKTGDAETVDNKEITVKDYSESAWSTTANINGKSERIKFNWMAKTTFIGLPLLLILGIISYFVFFRYSEKEEETATGL